MPVLLVRNQTPGPLVLVDERGGDRQEYQWEPNGTQYDGDCLEVPKELAKNVNFRRNVQKGNLKIEDEIDDERALMGPSDSEWARKQMAGAPVGAIGEAGAIPVIIDKTAAKPITTMQTDADGNIIDVNSMSPEDRQQQRQEMTPGAAPTSPAVPNRQPIPQTPQVFIDPAQGGAPATTEGPTRQPQYNDPFLSAAPEVPTPGMKTSEQSQEQEGGEGGQQVAGSHLDPNQP